MTAKKKQMDFRSMIKRRLALQGLMVVMGIAAIVVSLMLKNIAEQAFKTFAAGFLGGTGMAVGGIGIFTGISSILALGNPAKLKKEEIDYHDERNRYIRDKGNAITAMVMLFLLYAAVIASAFINEMVFFTLLCVLLAHTVMMGVTKFVLKARY